MESVRSTRCRTTKPNSICVEYRSARATFGSVARATTRSGAFDPKTERIIEIPMPTRVTFTREIEFDEKGNIWTCSSNGPTRHNERGRGSLIRIELPQGEPAADEGVKLERIILPHHQVARQIPWHKSPHGELLQENRRHAGSQRHPDQQDSARTLQEKNGELHRKAKEAISNPAPGHGSRQSRQGPEARPISRFSNTSITTRRRTE